MNKKFLASSVALSVFLVGSQQVEAGLFDRFKKKPKAEVKESSSNEIKPEDGATLRVWESKGPEGDFMVYAGKKFEEKYGIPVQYEEVNNIDSLTRLGQDGPAGVGADVFVFSHDRMGEGISAGLVMENLVSSDEIKTNFMDAAVVAATRDNKVMAWPLAIETYAMFYNKDVLPKGPETFEELIKFGKDFTDKKNNQFGIFWECGNAYYGHAFLAMDGGYVFGKGGTDPEDIGIGNKGAVEGLEKMLELKPISIQTSGDVTYSTMMGLFQEGKAATIINGPWAIGDLKKSGTNYGIVPLPTFDGKNLNSFSGVRLAGVSTYSKYPKAAQLFAKFITSDDMMLERYKMTGQIPPVKSLLSAPEIADNGDVRPFLEQAMHSTPMPSIPEIKYFWTPVAAALVESWDGKAEPEKALDSAVVTMKEAINLAK